VQASVRTVETSAATAAGAAPAPLDPAPPATPATPATPRRLSQGLIELAGLALAVAFVAAVALDHQLSNDVFWQLAAGQWMLAHHGIIGADPFSYTEAHRRWVTDEWGSEVALAGLFRVFGSSAYALYAIVLGAASLGASAAYARALGARGGRVAAIVLALSVGISGVLASDRGLDFSLVWLPLELLVLVRAREDARWLLCLPVLFVAWANTHGSVLIGLAVLAVELVWSCVPTRVVARFGGIRQSSQTGPLALASPPRASRRTGRACWRTTSAWRATARSASTSTSGTRRTSTRR
jgi:hypothetical protein